MIAAWQKRQTLPPTGFVTAAQQQALLRQAAPAIARFDDEQKKTEEAKRKAEDEARVRAAQPPASPSTMPASPSAAAPSPSVPDPQSPGPRDGFWFGALDCKQTGRHSMQGNVSNGSGKLSGASTTLSLSIVANKVSIQVQSLTATGANGSISGELRGRSVFARGSLSRFGHCR